MSAELFYEISGLGGVAFYLGSYAALQAGLVKGNGYTYATLNLIAASLVLMSLFGGWNLWSAIIQISWISLSVIGMARVYLLTQALRFNDEERALMDARFTTMRRLDMRKLLDRGGWHDAPVGEVLTTQGAPVSVLSYIHDGEVEILIGDQVIAHVGAGEFIGEMACLDQGPASATVRISQPARLFQVSSGALNSMIKSNADLKAQLEFAFAGNIRSKLIKTNALLEKALRSQTAAE